MSIHLGNDLCSSVMILVLLLYSTPSGLLIASPLTSQAVNRQNGLACYLLSDLLSVYPTATCPPTCPPEFAS